MNNILYVTLYSNFLRQVQPIQRQLAGNCDVVWLIIKLFMIIIVNSAKIILFYFSRSINDSIVYIFNWETELYTLSTITDLQKKT